jgi:hypothetical protein
VDHQAGEIRLADGRRNQRIDDVLDQRIHDAGESGAYDNGNGQIDNVPAQNKAAKAF